MRAIAFLLLSLLAAVPVTAQTSWTVGVFPQGTTDKPDAALALASFELVQGEDVTCGVSTETIEEPVNPSYLEFQDGDRWCLASIHTLWQALPDGVYVVAMRGADGYQEVSPPFRKVTRSQACFDGDTRYGVGEGPAVERYPNSTVDHRATYLARERALVSAGFDVRVLLVSTSVYFMVTCR